MKRLIAVLFALAVAILPLDAFAQNIVGRWTGWTDWTGTEYDSTDAWWEFRSDGTFVDNAGATGSWSQAGPTVRFMYGSGGLSVYTATVSNDMMTGTMANSDQSFTGRFSLTRGGGGGGGKPSGAVGSASANELTIRVCNNSGRNAFTAVLYRGGNQWHSEGWFRVDNGACEDIAITDNLRFYVFAEEVGNTDYAWAGNHEHCISRPGPYNDVFDPNATVCRDGQESVMFTEWLAEDYGTFTWTLDP